MERTGELALLAAVASGSSWLMKLAGRLVTAASLETESMTTAVGVRLSLEIKERRYTYRQLRLRIPRGLTFDSSCPDIGRRPTLLTGVAHVTVVRIFVGLRSMILQGPVEKYTPLQYRPFVSPDATP